MALHSTPYMETLPEMVNPAGKKLNDTEKAVGPPHTRRTSLERTAGQALHKKLKHGEPKTMTKEVRLPQQIASPKERHRKI